MSLARRQKVSKRKDTFCDHWLFTTWSQYSTSVSSWLGKMAKECNLSVKQAVILINECSQTGKLVDETDFWAAFNSASLTTKKRRV